tara:strand:+ start:129 stop:926 length:798 start_codon:yes stop_codon:yes gene_type:complete
MNRVLKRPMFRIGGSAGTGITSGLDKPREQYANGTPNPFATNLAPGTLPGFLTSFGLDLLSRPPSGGLLSTVAQAARGPLEQLQAGELRRSELEGERAFKRELQQELIESQEKIAGMKTKDNEALLEKYDGNQIKAAREQNFYDTEFANLQNDYGQEGVATEVIDSSDYVKKGSLKKLVKSRPELTRQVIYDVAKGKAMKLVKNKLTGDFELVPADSADIDTTGDQQPSPRQNPGLFGQPTKPNIIGPKIEELGEEFSQDFYQGT